MSIKFNQTRVREGQQRIVNDNALRACPKTISTRGAALTQYNTRVAAVERLCDDTDLAERTLLGSVLDLATVRAKVQMRGRAAKPLIHTRSLV